METEPQASSSPAEQDAATVLPPWAAVGKEFYGHHDWRIDEIAGLWVRVVEAKSRSDTPDEAWIYLPTGVVYGSTTFLRRTGHGIPTVSR